MPTVIVRASTSAVRNTEEEKKDGQKQIKFSGDDMKNVVENIQDSGTGQVDEEIEAFKRDNIVNSSICDGLIANLVKMIFHLKKYLKSNLLHRAS